MTTEKSWNTCKFAVATGGGEIAYELKNHGLNQGYYCDRREITILYPTAEIRIEDGSFVKLAELHTILIGDELSEDDVKKLEAMVERALAGCKHCEFHESK